MKLHAACLAVLAIAALAAPAGAATIDRSGGAIWFTENHPDAPRVVAENRLFVTTRDGDVLITEPRQGTFLRGEGCRALGGTTGPNEVLCERDGIGRITLDLGGRDDSATLALPEGAPPVAMSGGEGTDLVTYRTGPVAVSLDSIANDGPVGRGDNVGADVENVDGTGADDSLAGSDAPNRLTGGNGRDTIVAGGGDDVIDAREFVDCGEGDACPDPQSDTISCGDGIDIVDGDATDNVDRDCEVVVRGNGITLTAGPDRFAGFRPGLEISGAAGNDRLAGRGDDTINGNSGDDILRAGWAGENTIRGGSGDDGLIGGGSTDFLVGGSGRDRLRGAPGKDSIDGGLGRDLLIGGFDNDRIVARERSGERDRVSCGPGRDVVIADRKDAVSDDCERVRRR